MRHEAAASLSLACTLNAFILSSSIVTVFLARSPEGSGSRPRTSIVSDWFGDSVPSPPSYRCSLDEACFAFEVWRDAPAAGHPEARPGEFRPGLWKHDVAECFLRNPVTGHYLEVNLSPNGAWWSCFFSAPRTSVEGENPPLPDVVSRGEESPVGWSASIRVPWAFVRERLDLGADVQLHVAFILDRPRRFLSTCDVPDGDPDFHDPALPQMIEFAASGKERW